MKEKKKINIQTDFNTDYYYKKNEIQSENLEQLKNLHFNLNLEEDLHKS